MKAESRRIPQKLVTRLKFAYLFSLTILRKWTFSSNSVWRFLRYREECCLFYYHQNEPFRWCFNKKHVVEEKI